MRAAGADTFIADIVRKVDLAQTEAPRVQRVADAIAGKFAYGVMALAGGTFLFWRGYGASRFPSALALGARGGLLQCLNCLRLAIVKGPTTMRMLPVPNPQLPVGGGAGASPGPPTTPAALALQLACNVLVTACPCALGLVRSYTQRHILLFHSTVPINIYVHIYIHTHTRIYIYISLDAVI